MQLSGDHIRVRMLGGGRGGFGWWEGQMGLRGAHMRRGVEGTEETHVETEEWGKHSSKGCFSPKQDK